MAPMVFSQKRATRSPVLSAGKATPLAFKEWENGCLLYFSSKCIDEELKVVSVACGLKDSSIRSWYFVNRVELNALNFDEFMARLRDEFLETDWAYKLRFKIGRMTQGDRPWNEFVNAVGQENSLLLGTKEYLAESIVRDILFRGMNDRTADRCRGKGIGFKLDFKTWCSRVKEEDRARREEEVYIQKRVSAMLKEREREYLDDSLNNASPGLTNRPSRAANSASNTTKRCPALTEAERRLLRKHQGCHKCRRFYAGHTSATCPYGFPDGTKYKALTEKAAFAMRDKNNKILIPTTIITGSLFVNDEDSANDSAALPSAVLGNGSESEESDW